MWGTNDQPQESDSLINTFSGMEIVPGEEPTAGVSNLIERKYINYEISPVDNAFMWETRKDFIAQHFGSDPDEAARKIIKDSIKENSSRIAELLESLGINGTIDLSDTIADDYVIAPQVGQASEN